MCCGITIARLRDRRADVVSREKGVHSAIISAARNTILSLAVWTIRSEVFPARSAEVRGRLRLAGLVPRGAARKPKRLLELVAQSGSITELPRHQ